MDHGTTILINTTNLLPKKDPDLIAVPDGCMDMPFCYSSAYASKHLNRLPTKMAYPYNHLVQQ